MDPAIRFPSVAHLQEHARKRIPHFAWEYLDSGEMAEATRDDNIDALQRITHGLFEPASVPSLREFRPVAEFNLKLKIRECAPAANIQVRPERAVF